MNYLITWPFLAAAVVLVALAAFVGYRGFQSSLRPFLIFRTGWALAIRAVWAVRRTAACVLLVIGSGAGLQLLFSAWHGIDDNTLLFASIAWQAVMATALAALAVGIHLFIIHDVFAPRRFGAETMFYRGEVGNQSLQPRPPSLGLLISAAAFGFAIWLLSFGLHAASNAVVFEAPRFGQYGPPRLLGFIAFYGTAVISFLIMTLVSLVRPALSLGARNPLVLGIRMALKYAPALYVVAVLLLIAPLILGPLSIFVPRYFFGQNEIARGAGMLLFLFFTVFQFFAVEASSVLFMNRAMNQSADLTDAAQTPAQSAD